MPTITTALAMESLLQYNAKESIANKSSPLEIRTAAAESQVSSAAIGTSAQRFFYSPALYATPELAPIPDVSSIAFSPNIYVVNHKRRGARPQTAAPSRANKLENQVEADALNGGDVIPSPGCWGIGKEEGDKKLVEQVEVAGIDEELSDDFLDPRDSLNVGTSGSDAEDEGSLRCDRLGNQTSLKSGNQDEYYDTAEEFFSDGSFSISSPSLKSNTENELHILKLSLIEESSKREVAEENLLNLNRKYENLLRCLSHASSSLRELPSLETFKYETDPAEICQEFTVLRLVSEALETELSKDEVDEAFMEIIGTKNHEIARLRDRMMYYEAMNREMSQRNQEAVDQSRKQRLRRRRMRKWIWGGVGLSIAVGASLLAHSYLPYRGKDPSSASSSNSSTSSDSSTDFTE